MAHPSIDDASNTPGPSNGIAEAEDDRTNGRGDVQNVFTITVKLPQEPFEARIQVSTQEQVQDIRQSIVDQPFAMQYSCFHLEHNCERVNDFVELSEVPGVGPSSIFTLVEDPYTEKEARMHFIRVRELIGAAGDRTDLMHGISAGASLHDSITMTHVRGNGDTNESQLTDLGNLADYKFDAAAPLKAILANESRAPNTVKSISLSPWNPPPYHLRTKGHLLYLIVINLEGEQFHITAHVSGFYLNRSSHNKFDPYPKAGPKTNSAHSLLTLLHQIVPKFSAAFDDLLEHNSQREPLAVFQLSNTIPASPWIVPPESVSLLEHCLDITRTQESFLISGAEASENLRDWNEEFQSTRELPMESVTDKVFRERLTSKQFADYNEAAARGAILVSRGELAPLNPTEDRDAQIFVHNNIFFSFGADGVGTYTTGGGDEAARAASGKDVMGVRVVNQLDIPGLFTTATVVVDYLGKRIICQSIVPGIFRQREPDEPQIDYGGVEGKDIIAEKGEFVKPFETLSKAVHVKKHPVWDKDGKRHDLEASVETKGLMGTDGRKYVLDLYRLTPLDVPWIEKHWSDSQEEKDSEKKDYPHRMAALRPELVESYRMFKLRAYVDAEVTKKLDQEKNSGPGASTRNSHAKSPRISTVPGSTSSEITEPNRMSNPDMPDADTEVKVEAERQAEDEYKASLTRAIYSNFKFALNPDVYSGQVPGTEDEREEIANDEADVRAACEYLTSTVIPKLVQQLKDGDVGFPLDGESLSTLLHKRGINIRYLGVIAALSSDEHPRVQALHKLSVQEMICRGFKHVASKYLRHLAAPLASACMSHLLNCFLGSRLHSQPIPEYDESLKVLYTDSDFAFEGVTVDSLRMEVVEQVHLRYRHEVSCDLAPIGREMQLLREISLKLGLQLLAKNYIFAQEQVVVIGDENGELHPSQSISPPPTAGKKKKKAKDKTSSPRGDSPFQKASLTFHPEDIVNFVPVVKDASPKSTLAEEAFEGGRQSMVNGQTEIGQELLIESLSLYEQIYGILHPEVARHYLSLASIYYSLEDKTMASDLARKAVIIAERTLGLDAAETILAYLNLGLFEHALGKSSLALRYVLHAMDLTKIVYGPNHPDSITTVNNGAVILQFMKRYHESRIWFEASLAISEQVSGKASANSATLLFQLAQALALDQDTRAAVNRMRESFSLFQKLLGPEDRNTIEAEKWVNQLTHSAVTQAKRERVLASVPLRRVHFPGRRPMPNFDQSTAEASGAVRTSQQNGGVDSRDIDDLIKFIDGEDAKKKKAAAHLSNGSSNGGKKRGNPKRRGGPVVNSANGGDP